MQCCSCSVVKFMLHVMLLSMLLMFRTFTLVLSEIRVYCPIWTFTVGHYYYYYYYHHHLQWCGHVKRMPGERIPKLTMDWIPWERRKRGRPRKTWMEGVQAAMTTRNLEPDQWRNREEWRLVSGRRRQLSKTRIDHYYYYYFTFMQGIYNHIRAANHVSRAQILSCSCSVFTVCAACNVISHVKYAVYLYISTSRSLRAVPNMAVFCSP